MSLHQQAGSSRLDELGIALPSLAFLPPTLPQLLLGTAFPCTIRCFSNREVLVPIAPPATTPLVRLLRYRVRDYRGIADVTLELGDTTVLMGENNVGKSALLEALGVALGAPATTSDLRILANGTTPSGFVIDLELAPWAGAMFGVDVIDLLGAMVRVVAVNQQRYFIRVTGTPDATLRVVELKRVFVDSWNAPNSGATLPLTSDQRGALWFSLLDARRDLVEELRQRGSPWAKLLRRLQLSATDRAQFESSLATLSANIASALPSAANLAAVVSTLQSVLGGQVTSSRLALLPSSLDDVWKTTDLLIAAANQPELSIGRQGLGARSLSSLLAFRAWLEVEWTGSAEAPLLVLTGFEEPEAHLHPQAQRAVFDEIGRVAGQKIISTHSPYFAAVAPLDSLRVLRRRTTPTIRSAQGISQAPGVDAAVLANIHRFCLQRNGDMLFARLVLLCEGDTDSGVLPSLARTWWGCQPEERGIAIVPMDSAFNGSTFARFLTALGIHWVMMLDGDPAGAQACAAIGAIAELVPELPNVLLLSHGTHQVDLETLIARSAPLAVARTFGTNAAHAAAIANETEAELVARLYSVKGVLSRRLGQELAAEWPSRAHFPSGLADIFHRADHQLS
ncbi:MAG: AAA family ATPase [Rhodoglobus sp.]